MAGVFSDFLFFSITATCQLQVCLITREYKRLFKQQPPCLICLPILTAVKPESINFCHLLTAEHLDLKLSSKVSSPITKERWPDLEVRCFRVEWQARCEQLCRNCLLPPPCCSTDNFQGCQLVSSFALLTDVPEKQCILGPFLRCRMWNECSVILN